MRRSRRSPHAILVQIDLTVSRLIALAVLGGIAQHGLRLSGQRAIEIALEIFDVLDADG